MIMDFKLLQIMPIINSLRNWKLNVLDFQRLRFWPFIVTHFVSTYRDSFDEGGWGHSPSAMQVTLSSVKLDADVREGFMNPH
jgi:hypothetical protein